MLVCSKHCGLVFTKDSYKTDMKLFKFATHTMFDSTTIPITGYCKSLQKCIKQKPYWTLDWVNDCLFELSIETMWSLMRSSVASVFESLDHAEDAIDTVIMAQLCKVQNT